MTATIIVAYATIGALTAYFMGGECWHERGHDGNKPGTAIWWGLVTGISWPLTLAIVLCVKISLPKYSLSRKFVTMLYGESRKVKQ